MATKKDKGFTVMTWDEQGNFQYHPEAFDDAEKERLSNMTDGERVKEIARLIAAAREARAAELAAFFRRESPLPERRVMVARLIDLSEELEHEGLLFDAAYHALLAAFCACSPTATVSLAAIREIASRRRDTGPGADRYTVLIDELDTLAVEVSR